MRLWIRGKLMLFSLYVQAFISRISPKYAGPSRVEAEAWALWNANTQWPLVLPTEKELKFREDLKRHREDLKRHREQLKKESN